MQEVSSAWKGVVLRQTATQAATQTESVIQIETTDQMMLLKPAVHNNDIGCSIAGPNTETNEKKHGNSNFNNRPDNTPYQTIMK